MFPKTLYALVLSIALVSLPALAQDQAGGRIPGCRGSDVRFKVKRTSAQAPAQPTAGKALIYFIQKDSNPGGFTTPTTMAGIDGNWVGATHGDSYFSISTDPGVHHLCVTTEFGGLNGGEATAVAHFTAEAGGIYYFEANNIAWRDSQTNDVSLISLDSDEGKYLAMSVELVTSRVKK